MNRIRFNVYSSSCHAAPMSPAKIPPAKSVKRRISVSGTQTIIHEADSQREGQLNVVLIPGNPGLSSFYVPYIEALHKGLESQGCYARIIAITHAGLGGLTKGKIFNLQQQIEHKLAFLEEHVVDSGHGPVVLIGHSIGAHMALQVAHAVEQRQAEHRASAWDAQAGALKQVILLHPFLAVTPENPKQRALWLLTSWPLLMALLSAAIGAVPEALKHGVVKAWAGELCQHALAASFDLLTLSNARNCFYLGQTEFRTLPTALAESWPKLRGLGSRAAVISKPQDSWFTDAHWEEMQREVPGIRAILDDLSHGFCTQLSESDQMAERTLEILQNVLDAALPIHRNMASSK